MNGIRFILYALKSLQRNPLRSLLTTLGIVIGVAAVIAIIEIGNGASGSLETTLSDLGVRNLLIRPGGSVRNGIRLGAGTAVTLTPEDCVAIERECPAIRAAVPMLRTGSRLIYGNNNWSPSEISGSTPEYLLVRNWEVERGGMFSNNDVEKAAAVCVIGRTVEDELFGSPIGVGKVIRANGVMLRVVGVLAYKGANLVGQDQDDIVIMPWTTLRYRVTGFERGQPATEETTRSLYPAAARLSDTMYTISFRNIDTIMAAVWENGDVEAGKAQITALLRERHKLIAEAPDDFWIRDFSEIGRMINTAVGLVTTLLMTVAAISLVVGGIGIMNIMMVSVTERTREIGLRMAVGARSRDILGQFLAEAVVLCLVGGIIGIVCGRGTALLLEWLLGWTAGASLWAIASGFGVSVVVGVIFGFYPAWKASRLDPIEALRFE